MTIYYKFALLYFVLVLLATIKCKLSKVGGLFFYTIIFFVKEMNVMSNNTSHTVW